MIKDGWYICPHCQQKLFKVAEKAHVSGIFIKCKGRNCGKIVQVNI